MKSGRVSLKRKFIPDIYFPKGQHLWLVRGPQTYSITALTNRTNINFAATEEMRQTWKCEQIGSIFANWLGIQHKFVWQP